MTTAPMVGMRIPNIALARLVDGQVQAINAADALSRRCLIMGIPGAFIPACSGEHVPDFIKSADRLRAGGLDQLACIVANDPYVVDAWSQLLDPSGKILFLSDGNLRFARALGLTMQEPDLFLGERSKRYVMRTDRGLINYFRVEPNVFSSVVAPATAARSEPARANSA